MTGLLFTLLILGTVFGGMALLRAVRKSDSGRYRRRFNGAPHRDDGAFPVASTLYLGDGGGASHPHHTHAADCSHHADAGGGCSDSGGGGSD